MYQEIPASILGLALQEYIGLTREEEHQPGTTHSCGQALVLVCHQDQICPSEALPPMLLHATVLSATQFMRMAMKMGPLCLQHITVNVDDAPRANSLLTCTGARPRYSWWCCLQAAHLTRQLQAVTIDTVVARVVAKCASERAINEDVAKSFDNSKTRFWVPSVASVQQFA